jgi:hypothetical protein
MLKIIIPFFVMSWAHAEAQLPKRLAHLQAETIEDQQCQADWSNWTASGGFQKFNLNDAYTTLYLIPCAQWAGNSVNMSWKVYTEFNEPEPDGHGSFRHVTLAGMDLHQNLVGLSDVYNGSWQADRQQLTSTYYFFARKDCGLKQVFQWDSAQQNFQLHEVRLKPTCDGQTEDEWPLVFPVDTSVTAAR